MSFNVRMNKRIRIRGPFNRVIDQESDRELADGLDLDIRHERGLAVDEDTSDAPVCTA